MNSEKIITSDPHRLILNLSDKINLKILVFLYTEKHKKSCENNKFKISVAKWNNELE